MNNKPKKLTPAQLATSQARREELKNISRPIQDVRGNLGGLALNLIPDDQRPLFELFQNRELYPTLNSCLETVYTLQTGIHAWKTFQSWRALGYKVKKGESGKPIWATPREITTRSQGEEPQGTGKEWFPISYLFHAGQVEEGITEYNNAVQTAAALQAQGKDKAARYISISETHGEAAAKHLQEIGVL